MKIPKITYADITVEDFKKECLKFANSGTPKYQIHEVVAVKGFLGSHTPAMIVSVSLRVGGWAYDVIRFNTTDGSLERRECVSEKEIEAVNE